MGRVKDDGRSDVTDEANTDDAIGQPPPLLLLESMLLSRWVVVVVAVSSTLLLLLLLPIPASPGTL